VGRGSSKGRPREGQQAGVLRDERETFTNKKEKARI
jgi:hypothetical protein